MPKPTKAKAEPSGNFRPPDDLCPTASLKPHLIAGADRNRGREGVGPFAFGHFHQRAGRDHFDPFGIDPPHDPHSERLCPGVGPKAGAPAHDNSVDGRQELPAGNQVIDCEAPIVEAGAKALGGARRRYRQVAPDRDSGPTCGCSQAN